MNRRSVAAWLLECRSEDLLGYTDYAGYVVVLNPAGQKFIFDNAQLARAEAAMTPYGAQERVQAMASKPVKQATKIRKKNARLR